MKKTKKRGFTIVELVIVIAVIAILAAVLVPTFTNVISAAKESKAMQEARGAYLDYAASVAAANKGEFPGAGVFECTDAKGQPRYYVVAGANFKPETATKPTAHGALIYTSNSDGTVAFTEVTTKS